MVPAPNAARSTRSLRDCRRPIAPARRLRPGTRSNADLTPRASAMTGGSAPHDGPVTLVSFDVDGTLIRSCGQDANRLHKEAFTYGFQKVFGIDTHIDVVAHHGGTDPLIAVKVLEHHGVPREQALAKLKDVEAAMLECFEANATRAGVGLQLLPGVVQLLEALQARRDVATCLVTGNLEPIGWAKMRALGIGHLFTAPPFGGFGSDHCSGDTQEMWRDRQEFVRIAAERAAERFPGGVRARFHVGDTPMDVQAALGAGARAIGVATGVFERAALECLGSPPDVVVLDSLGDTQAVLGHLGL